MRSPFPGMDPWLDRIWPNIHIPLIVYSADNLNQQFGESDLVSHIGVEDVAGTVQRRVEIGTVHNFGAAEAVVTVLTFLNPIVKTPGPVHDWYRRRQQEWLDAGVNLVEVDICRVGQYSLAAPEARYPAEYRAPYCVCTSRGGRFDLRPIMLRQSLPTIRIPLGATDQEVHLELQPLIDRCYRNGRCASMLRYDSDLEPPLSPDDAAYADEVLRQAGFRD